MLLQQIAKMLNRQNAGCKKLLYKKMRLKKLVYKKQLYKKPPSTYKMTNVKN
jgi:hypothetical protein